jgi:hypothetical protein
MPKKLAIRDNTDLAALEASGLHMDKVRKAFEDNFTEGREGKSAQMTCTFQGQVVLDLAASPKNDGRIVGVLKCSDDVTRYLIMLYTDS